MINNSPSQQQLNLENAQRLQLFGHQQQQLAVLAAAQQQQQQQAAANSLQAFLPFGADALGSLGQLGQAQLSQLLNDPHGRAMLGGYQYSY